MKSYNPYRKYSSYWWKYWLNFPGDVLWFFKRIWSYREILWHDNDFDFASVLHIMRFKLKRMRKHMEEHAISANSEDTVAELAQVDVLLRNVMDEDPENEWSRHCDQWHHYLKDGWNLNQCKAKRERSKSVKAGMKREEENWHKLWVHIDQYMRGWWD